MQSFRGPLDSRGMLPLLSLLVTVVTGLAFWTGSFASAAIGVAVVATFVWIVARRALAKGLPERVRIEPASDFDELPTTGAAVDELLARGFVQLGAPQTVNLHPPLVLVPLAHRDRGVLAAVYQQNAPRPRTVVDLVTAFANGETLTTSSAREAATLPPVDRRFLQTLHDASIEELSVRHHDAIATLRAIGRRTESTAAVTLADFVHALARHVREQRDQLDQAPVRTTTIALWRALVGCRGHERPLAEQLSRDADATPATAN